MAEKLRVKLPAIYYITLVKGAMLYLFYHNKRRIS